jgi:glycosidase
MEPAPLIYEVNTRVWLRELSEQQGQPITLRNVPEPELDRWMELGFTHVWLMGVWRIGPEARAKALEYWEKEWKEEIPSTPEDVTGSPYANLMPDVEPSISSIAEVTDFHQRLLDKGLYLILDFVPNHLGIDHPWVSQHPALFVQSATAKPGTFQKKTKFGKRYFAYGRDPYFPPWTDTIQFDYRTQPVQNAMASLAANLSILCDGFRCDMAMLVLSDIFAKTWKDFPPQVKDLASGEFWPQAIQQVGRAQMGAPGFLFIGEAYWDTEERLQNLGFDYTYHKKVYDFVVRRQHQELQQYLTAKSADFLGHGAYFLENHDEPRIASLLPFEEHKAAALFMFGLPGMRMIHDGQLEGRKSFARIQMSKRRTEEPDAEISNFYTMLLKKLGESCVGKGEFTLIQAVPLSTEKAVPPVFFFKWQAGDIVDLVVVNLTTELAVWRVPVASILEGWGSYNVHFKTQARFFLPFSPDEKEWHFEVPGHAAEIIRFSKLSPDAHD